MAPGKKVLFIMAVLNSIRSSTEKYLSMIRVSHTLFALPFAGIAFVQALPGSAFWKDGPLDGFYPLLGKIVLAMAALRSAAMGFNRIADRYLDAQNPRTGMREIPAGKISLRAACIFFGAFSLIFTAAAFWINALCGFLSPLALGLALGYSYSKRFTFLCHYWLGAVIGIAPTATWLAVRQTVEILPVLWTLAMLFYISGFDILYSCQDVEFDRKQNLHSIPSRFGITAALWTARFGHLTAVALIAAAGMVSVSGIWFFAAAAAAAGLFLIEHILVRPHTLQNIPVAFFHINASISSVLFAGILLDRIFH